MATKAPAGISTPPDAAWMRERLDELCAFERGSASEGERRRPSGWPASCTRPAPREVRIEEEPEANGTFWWPLGLLAGAARARRPRRPPRRPASRLFAAATGAAAAALIADELPPGSRRFRRLLPKRSCHHVLGEIGPPRCRADDRADGPPRRRPHAFFFNPAITEAVGENAPWVFEHNDTSPPLMWPVVGGPALVAAGAVLGSRR